MRAQPNKIITPFVFGRMLKGHEFYDYSVGPLNFDLPSLMVFGLRRGTRIRNSKQNKNKTEKNKTLNNFGQDHGLN